MDRPIAYTQEQGRSTDFLFAQRSTMIAIAKLSQAVFGSNTVVRGLAVTPNSPAALNVLVGLGEIYTIAAVDATSWGSMAADTDQILQQGINPAIQTISTPAPSTAGYSINYLLEAQFQQIDSTPVVLPFYNSANPSQPLNGQGGGGATLPTERQGVCVIQAKAGVAATTGTQVTPSVDSGWTALAVVTVANGQSTVTSGNISIPAGVPQVSSLLQMMQTGSTTYAVDTSTTPNAISLALTPAVTAYSDGNPVCFKAANNNTGPCTINWGGGSIALNGANGALQGGEIIAGKQYEVAYNSTTGTAVLVGQSGGALQVAPATQSQHAVQMAQAAGVVGSVRNLVMTVASASATATLTADEIIVETALGGVRYCLPSFNKTINLGTTGAGGMDVAGLPATAAVAIYAIYNPSTGASALLGWNASSAAAPNIYGGGAMPAGYTASALVSVLQVTSSQFVACYVQDRHITINQTNQLTTSSSSSSNVSLSIGVPKNAKTADLFVTFSSTAATNANVAIGGNSSGGLPTYSFPVSGQSGGMTLKGFPLSTIQNIWYTISNSAGTPTTVISLCGYDI